MYEDETIEEELVIKRIEGQKTDFSLLQFNITASAILFKEIWAHNQSNMFYKYRTIFDTNSSTKLLKIFILFLFIV